MKAEISALQAQLAHCENQLAAHNEKVCELEKSMSEEHQRSEEEARAQQEAMMREIEKLQAAIAQASAQAEHAQVQSQQILQEVKFYALILQCPPFSCISILIHKSCFSILMVPISF